MVKPITIPISYKSDPKGLRQAEKDLKGLASGIGKAIGAATAVVAGIGIASVKAFADFDGAMTKSLAIMGDVSDALRKDMSDAAREVAKTTTFSAEEAAEAYFFLASAGLDAEQAIGALPAVANFAQAGMFDMATATDLLTDAQSALGMTSDDTAENLELMVELSDMLVRANQSANASVEEFSEALTNKGAVAMGQFGLETAEGIGVMSVFAENGIKGSRAGTLLSATLNSLSTNAQTNAGAFEDLGVAVFDSEGNTRDMVDIVGDLEAGMEGMSDEQRLATLRGLGFNRQALEGMGILIGNSDALGEFTESVEEAGGATDEVAGKQLETFNAQLGILGDFVKDIGIAIGEELGEAMSDLVDELKPVIETIGDALIPAFKEITPSIALFAGALPGLIASLVPILPVMVDIAAVMLELAIELLPVFLEIVDLILPGLVAFTGFLVENSSAVAILAIGIGGLVVAFTLFNTIARIVNLTVLAFAAAKGIATVAQRAFNLAMMANPIGIVIALVAALITGLALFFTQTETGQKAWAAFTEFLGSAWEGFKEGFFIVLEAVGKFFKDTINGFIGMFESFVNFFINGINSIIRGINRLSFSIPSIGNNPSLTIGFNIPTIPNISLPRLADGGIVTRQTTAIIGEAGPEAVIPLDRLGEFGGGTVINVTVNAGVGTNGTEVGREIVAQIKRYERSSGRVFASA